MISLHRIELNKFVDLFKWWANFKDSVFHHHHLVKINDKEREDATDQSSESLIWWSWRRHAKMKMKMTRSSYKFCILIYRVQPGANCKFLLLSLPTFHFAIFHLPCPLIRLPIIGNIILHQPCHLWYHSRLLLVAIDRISSLRHLKVFSHAHQTNWAPAEPLTVLGKSGTPPLLLKQSSRSLLP